MEHALYLIPNTLGECETSNVLPAINIDIIREIKHFIVEDVRTARRFLKKVDSNINIDELQFYTLNKHTSPNELSSYLEPLEKGFDMGVISEAGCPAIADPGAEVVKMAQTKNLKVVPLVGPSSILLGLMASGFNGQSFAFVGYLPIQGNERTQRIKQLEKRAKTENQSQIFIETPYRNQKLLSEILSTCQGNTKLCIACDITLESEYIKTKSINEWKKSALPDLNKRPSIFILY
ncbi:MAG: SAM-dependent methyltransferase [Paludibacteraceae bacterium]|jgi:16S rRNA (cytidine1402-2'-O)-methyltransferase|nr:SAM-dependent methyltransferase [Paludibacteraceae bacterium]MEE0910962.1 SAM-dependent methyltransferase [Paludibacteraceae bacterium]